MDAAPPSPFLRLASGIRLRHDRVRQRHVLLGPERGFVLNATGAAVIEALGQGCREEEVLAVVAGDERTRRDETRAFLEELIRKNLVVRT